MADPRLLTFEQLDTFRTGYRHLVQTGDYPVNGDVLRLLGHIEALEAQVVALRQALTDIARGEGRFSRDPLEHASNTIEAMKQLATEALETKPCQPK